MMDDAEWFMDWRVWGLVIIFGMILAPILYKQMINDLAMGKVKAIVTLTFGVAFSYIPGKIFIDKGG